MIVGTLTVCYRDPRIAIDKIQGVPQKIYKAIAADLEMGPRSALRAFDVITTSGMRVSIVKALIRSVSFEPTGDEPEDISMPSWVRIR